jgi:hypothetical protein
MRQLLIDIRNIGIEPMYLFASGFIVWAFFDYRKYHGKWKTLRFTTKNNIIIRILGAKLATIASVAIYIETHGG